MSPTDAPLWVLQVLDPDGCGLRVTFFRDGDRYGHEIACLTEGSAATVCLRTELGRDRDPWPASPPLQQGSLEPSPHGGQMALLIGMAGKSHWSQSVETDPGTTGLTFDVACRVHRQPEWLGSSYRASRKVALITEAGVGVAAAPGLQLALISEAPDGSFPSRMDFCGSQVAIAADLSKLRVPSTVRWRYRIALLGAPAASNGAMF